MILNGYFCSTWFLVKIKPIWRLLLTFSLLSQRNLFFIIWNWISVDIVSLLLGCKEHLPKYCLDNPLFCILHVINATFRLILSSAMVRCNSVRKKEAKKNKITFYGHAYVFVKLILPAIDVYIHFQDTGKCLRPNTSICVIK